MFLDKRDEKGQLLSFKAFAISEEVAELGIKNFKKTEIFKELKNLFSEKYLILLFKKLIFESVYETSCKALLSKYSKDKVIDTDFYSINLLKENKYFSDCILINKSKKINLDNIKKFFIDFFWEQYSIISKILHLFSFILRFKKKENKNAKIAVNFLEGLKIDERSDFFWYDKKSFFNNVITYFEDGKRISRFEKNKDLIFKRLKFLNIRYEYLYQLRYFLKNSNIDAIRRRIEKINSVGDEKFLKKKALIYISKIQYMFNFFKENNIKVHYNSEEMGTGNILRQIAIKLNGGCSFGRTKSYPTKIKGDFIGFFPNDIFFTWGKETAKRVSQTENYIDHIIITGDHYPKISNQKKILFEKKINNLKSHKLKFFILILDSSFSENKEFTWQLTFKEKMETFFKKIFAFQNDNPDVGLIIKSKKKDNLRSIKPIFLEIINRERNNRCIFINENNDLSSHYSEFADFTISISPHIQGALFHCLINNKKFRGAMFDDSNLSLIEKEIYNVGENKTIFRNLNKLMNELKVFKNKSNQESDLGKWLDTSNHDPFCDGKGGERVQIFLKNLINFYDQGLKTDKAIKKTINEYTKVYNSDKIYEKK
tara:strand:- start:8826 stop:10619 length:1794 start_codon:yes stop_codon:yes gene_type:complete